MKDGVKKFLTAFRRKAEGFDRYVLRGLDRMEQSALRSLQKTRQFENQTGDLRASFMVAGGQGFTQRGVMVDPTRMSSLANHPQPSVYGRFVNFGTRLMSARPFASDAREMAFRAAGRAFNAGGGQKVHWL